MHQKDHVLMKSPPLIQWQWGAGVRGKAASDSQLAADIMNLLCRSAEDACPRWLFISNPFARSGWPYRTQPAILSADPHSSTSAAARYRSKHIRQRPGALYER